MKRQAVILTFILSALFFTASSAAYAAGDAVPLKFSKYGGGEWIYCNNPEFISNKDLSSDENPQATYLMQCKDLAPGRYQVFFCLYNYTDYMIEPDIEFKSTSGGKMHIDAAGYSMPVGEEYFDCIGAWADYLKTNIRTVNGIADYSYYNGENRFGKSIDLSKRAWASSYIYNYDAVPRRVTFNMLLDFTVDEGTVEADFTALKNYGRVGDRTHHKEDALPGEYKNDTSVKGIETASLPMSVAKLKLDLDDSVKDNARQDFTIYNPYFPEGNIVNEWVTNINIHRDEFSYTKTNGAFSDMLSLHYKDDSKLKATSDNSNFHRANR